MDPIAILWIIVQSTLIVGLVSGTVYLIHRRLITLYADKPEQQFQRQMITVGLVLLGVLIVVLTVPVDAGTRGSLLSLFGIIVSATIALSSTTLVGNVMAGLMMRAVGSYRLGDYVRVGEYFGRISEMDLLHTEIQTEERDLTTLPNIFMATHPVRVMRTSGTILSVELSLGYDVSRHKIEALLLEAGKQCGLESPFVQIKELGDFSVTYAIAGLLTDVKSVLGKRRQLRAATMDALHAAEIEIASPVLVSTRAFSPKQSFIAPTEETIANSSGSGPDSIVFDKAIEAESLGNLRERQNQLSSDLKRLNQALAEDEENEAIQRQQALTAKKLERLEQLIVKREAKISSD
ncbi:MAG: mechanosensitive ion channel family protein [Woeseiaceae bacterium]